MFAYFHIIQKSVCIDSLETSAANDDIRKKAMAVFPKN
ncbi:hypothetical protein PITCH_A580017 [uncultured Desulfobacterium sp.]|uniref:Uncharacterized protein n=1 Tax=uncultured Desulfobacterium sp. TaxID=201089 RepID=A0A445N101_9BACT|nr:hypothetical protein PITCH_A580017 [uncultured Desulfobacterium sp.]